MPFLQVLVLVQIGVWIEFLFYSLLIELQKFGARKGFQELKPLLFFNVGRMVGAIPGEQGIATGEYGLEQVLEEFLKVLSLWGALGIKCHCIHQKQRSTVVHQPGELAEG